MWVPSLGRGDPLEEGMASHSSILAWRIPWTGVLRAIVHGVAKSWTQLVRKHLTGGFLCAVLDLSGILCSFLIPEYSGIKRRGKPLPGLRTEESRHFLC